MIEVRNKCIKYKYFANKICKKDRFKLVSYVQCDETRKILFFVRFPFYTKILFLTKDLINMKSFTKNTRYEIRRAEKDRVEFQIEHDLSIFINFYNKFAAQSGLKPIKSLSEYKESNILVTKAVKENRILCMHVYLLDKESYRARLLYSASHFRGLDDIKLKGSIGRANRFLHYNDMIYLMDLNYKYYDFGGYAPMTKDISLININKFKDSFGGELIENSNYISLLLFILIKIKRLLVW